MRQICLIALLCFVGCNLPKDDLSRAPSRYVFHYYLINRDNLVERTCVDTAISMLVQDSTYRIVAVSDSQVVTIWWRGFRPFNSNGQWTIGRATSCFVGWPKTNGPFPGMIEIVDTERPSIVLRGLEYIKSDYTIAGDSIVFTFSGYVGEDGKHSKSFFSARCRLPW